MTAAVRLFVGNVPPELDEERLKEEFSQYGRVVGAEVKQKKGLSDEVRRFAFVTVHADNYAVNRCMEEKNLLQVSVAKESFMERLQREREEKNQKNQQNAQINSTQNSTAENDYKLVKKYQPEPIVVPKKMKLVIPSATPAWFSNEDRPPKRKRQISDPNDPVDEPSQNNNAIVKIGKPEKVLTPKPEKVLTPSDIRRLEAIKNMKEAYKNKQQLLKKTLCDVDKKLNNKITFNDDGDIISNNFDNKQQNKNKRKNTANDKKFSEYSNGHSNKKLGLFDEQSDEDDKEEYNFEVKPQFQGEAGQKLIELQSRYKADKRFILDERFIEDNNEGEHETVDTVETMEDSEKLKQMEILEGIIGKSLTAKSNDPSKKASYKTMLRYDPTRTDHSKFINVPSKTDEKKDGRKKKNEKRSSEAENESKPAPVVSQERYYKVEDTLKQAMEDKNPFSLLSLFGGGNTESATNEEYSFKTLENGKKNNIGSKNPFHFDSSDSEDEGKNGKRKAADVIPSVPEAQPVINEEKLFFSECDDRLKEGLEFFLNREAISNESRQKLKFIVKKRIQNNLRNESYQVKKASKASHHKNSRTSKFKRK